MAEIDCRATGSKTRIYPYCLFWLLEIHSLRRDTLFNLDTLRASVLPQSNVLDFVDSPLEVDRGVMVCGSRKGGGSRRRRRGKWIWHV